MKILMIAFLASAFFLTSCDEETDDDDDTVVVTPAAPTELMATSIDSTTIHIKWTASTSESDANWDGYHLMVSTATGEMIVEEHIMDHTSGDPYPISDLTAGEIYSIELYSEYADGTRSEEAATIEWSPAIRFSTAGDGTSDIALHERASSLGSGLDLYFYDTDFDEKGTASLSVSERADWNLALDTGTDGLIRDLGSGSLLYTDGGYDEPTEMTMISNPIAAESLNDVFDSEGLDSKNFSEQVIDLTNYTSNQVIYVKVTNGSDEYYAKVLLKYAGSDWLQGTEPNRYIAAEISFQERSGVPYAEVEKSSGNTK